SSTRVKQEPGSSAGVLDDWVGLRKSCLASSVRGVGACETRHFLAARNGVAKGPRSTMPKFYCDYCDTYLTHDSPSVRKTHCSGRKHKENVKDYYQKWMEEQAQSLIDKTSAFQSLVLKQLILNSKQEDSDVLDERSGSGCISTRKDTTNSILCSSSCRGNDPTSPKSPGSSSSWYDASTPYGGPSHDANDGPSSSWDDASGACSWNEATYGRPHANDAWTPNDETSCPSHDGTHPARNDSTR
ncbi:hypothetical protein MC885_006930, partial [Smutsia gigantea]